MRFLFSWKVCLSCCLRVVLTTHFCSYADTTASSACSLCASGSFASAPRQTACLACSAGSFAANAGQSVCSFCQPGTVSTAKGSVSCTSCLANTFAPFVNSTQCHPCPPSSSSQIQSPSCQCYVNFYSFTSAGPLSMQCVACSDGANCSQAGLASYNVSALSGWAAPPSNPSQAQSPIFYPCPLAGSCVAGGCAVGYTGPLCALCAHGYYERAYQCFPCGDGVSLGFLIMIPVCVPMVCGSRCFLGCFRHHFGYHRTHSQVSRQEHQHLSPGMHV